MMQPLNTTRSPGVLLSRQTTVGLWIVVSVQWMFLQHSCGQELLPSDGRIEPIEMVPLVENASTPRVEGLNNSSVPTPEMVELVRHMVLASIKPTYVDEKQWNKKRQVWDGVFVQLKDGKLITHKKSKEVRAGTWTRATVKFVEPEQTLQIQIERLEPLPDGRMAFDSTTEARLDVWGQLAEWVRDVKVLSMSGSADATVRLRIQGTVQLRMNPTKFPPDVTVIPHIDYAHADLVNYRVRRVGDIGGDAAKLLGESMKAVVDGLVEDENAKLADRINRKLVQRAHKMTFSSQKWLEAKVLSTKNTPVKDAK